MGGSSTGTTSSRARNPGTKMSILQSLGSLAFIAWPISWKLSEIYSKSKMRWTALNCLSSLTNTSNLRTMLRFAMLTKLRRGVTCLLSAKTAKEQIMVRPIKPIIKGKRNIKGKSGKAKRTKSRANGPNPRVPHLALPPELGNEDHRAIPQRRSSSRPSCLFWTWEDTIRA